MNTNVRLLAFIVIGASILVILSVGMATISVKAVVGRTYEGHE